MRKKVFTAILFCCSSIILKAQDTVILTPGPHWDREYDMNKLASVYLDETGSRSVQAIVRQPFIKYSDLRQVVRQNNHKNNTAWVRWIVHNPADTTEHVLFLFHRFSFLSFYVADSAGIHFTRNNKAFYSSGTKNERRSFVFAVPGNGTVTVYAEHKEAFRNYAADYPIMLRSSELKTEVGMALFSYRYYVFTDILFLAVILFITIHTLAQYFFSRRREFLLYAFYASTVFIFFLYKFDDYSYVDTSFAYFPYIQKYGNNPLSYLMYYAYYRFVRSFIDFKEIAPWFYRSILITEKVLLAAIAVDIILVQLNLPPVKSIMFNVIRCYLVLMAFTGIFLLFRSRKPLALFIAVGSGCLITGGLISMILSWILSGPYTGFDPIINMQLGMVLELLCFTLGLSYKTSLIEKEKRQTQLQLIMQLEENRLLQDEMKTKLETRVQEQTEKIVVQQQQLEKEKEQQLMLEFTKKLT